MSATDAVTESQQSHCPQCGAAQGAGRTSFCGECGYSERMGRDGDLNTVEEDVKRPSPMGFVVFAVGVVLIPLMAVAMRCYLWEAPGLSLSAWLYWTCVIGGGMALVGHLLGWSVCVARSDMDLSDLVCSPIRIWTMVFRSLPKGITALCLFGFGLTMAGSGLLAFGVDYETMVRKSPPDTRENLMALVTTVKGLIPDLAALGDGAEELTGGEADASVLFGDTEETTSPVSVVGAEASQTAARQTTSCLIIGYVEGTDGELESLVLAVPEVGAIRYAGMISIGDVEADAFHDLVDHSLSLTRSSSVVACPVEAKWLQPDAVGRVEFDGWSKSRELLTPRLLEITEHLSQADLL